MSAQAPLLDPSIFANLESRIEEETQVRDTLTQIVQRLERAVASAQGLLSRGALDAARRMQVPTWSQVVRRMLTVD